MPSRAPMLNNPNQCVPTTGPRAACGPPQIFQSPAEAFTKKTSNLKFVEMRVRLHLS